jgi:hypothetical protein
VRNHLEKNGKSIGLAIAELSGKALTDAGFNSVGENIKLIDKLEFDDPSYYQNLELVKEMAKKLGIITFDAANFEVKDMAVHISLDDVCVKKQSETRPSERKVGEHPKVYNTVIHIEAKEGQYIINGDGLTNTMILLLGFLAYNNLLFTRPLVFYCDGDKNIHNEIKRLFSFTNYQVTLDWWHLKKKFQEQLSMALKGKKIRNELLGLILPLLWYGDINGAISLLNRVDPSNVKQGGEKKLEYLIDYLSRKRDYIPIYALRKELGLRTSSNRG